MRHAAAVLLVVALPALAAACGSEQERAPGACLGPAERYAQALRDAPGTVELAPDTQISECLVPSQEGGELAEVGSAMVAAATRLNREARDATSGESAALRLGYLIGAASRGAEGTAGIHTDLIRRLNSAARFDPSGAPGVEFERAFGRGYAAGRESG